MARSSYSSRSPASLSVWLVAALLVAGTVIAVTQVKGGTAANTSSVELSSHHAKRVSKWCPAVNTKAGPSSRWGTYRSHGATQHLGDGQEPLVSCSGQGKATPSASASPAATPTAGQPTATQPAAGLDVLARDCSGSKLQEHTGFQDGNRCVTTEFGEVGDSSHNPSLLITEHPRNVKVNTPFTLSVSTRNLVRDRFLGAAAGGYYKETSLLNNAGLVRGHFHTACRNLDSTTKAPNPDPVPAFFVATEDGGGGANPDTVKITVAGIANPGIVQCAVWAGDGSHRVPMMQRANQIPAFDVVRVHVNR